MTARLLIGDVREALALIPDNSIDLIVTSPPFFHLRSYLAEQSEVKYQEIGQEATPGEYIDSLLDVVIELRRVLAPHGTLVWELGDTMGGSGGAGGDYADGGQRDGQPKFDGSARARRRTPEGFDPSTAYARSPHAAAARAPKYASHGNDRAALEAAEIMPRRLRTRRHLEGYPLDKSMVMIPELFRLSLAYGFNPLTGREIEPWIVRNTVTWCRRSPNVGREGDKFRRATSDIVVACTSPTRYYDVDPILEPAVTGEEGALRPPYDYWLLSDEPFKGAHFAVYPQAVVIPFVDSMCPERVCTICGEPRRRIVKTERVRIADGLVNPPRVPVTRSDSDDGTTSIGIRHAIATTRHTTGWTDCGHGDNYRAGIVLDPFAGSGTTGMVATRHGRDAVMIDLDARNVALIQKRIGMFLTDVQYVRSAGEVPA